MTAQRSTPFVAPKRGTNLITENTVGHRWLGSLFNTGPRERATLDTIFLAQANARGLFVNNKIFSDRNVLVAVRLPYFDRELNLVVSFGLDIARCTLATCTELMLFAGDCCAK